MRELPSSLGAMMSFCIQVDDRLRTLSSLWAELQWEHCQAKTFLVAWRKWWRWETYADRMLTPHTCRATILPDVWWLPLWLQRAYCHYLYFATKRAPPPVMVGVLVVNLSSKNFPPCLMLTAKLIIWTETHFLAVLIDLGAEQSFMDTKLAHQLNISTEALPHALCVWGLSCQCLPDITHATKLVTLIPSANHSERISFSSSVTPGYSSITPRSNGRRHACLGWGRSVTWPVWNLPRHLNLPINHLCLPKHLMCLLCHLFIMI